MFLILRKTITTCNFTPSGNSKVKDVKRHLITHGCVFIILYFNMKNQLFALCFLCFGSVFSQSLENRIYNTVDAFNNKKSAEALITLNNSISTFETQLSTIDDYMAFIHLLTNKAYYLLNQNKNSTAISTYEKAFKLYKEKQIAKTYDYDVIENCMKPLGVLYNRVGDYTSSENITKNYIALAKKNNDNSQLIAGFTNLSRLYQTLGRHQQAIDIANYGLTIKGINTLQKKNLKGISSRSKIRLNKNVKSIDNVIVPPINFGAIEDKEIAFELAMQKKDYKAALNVFKSLKNMKKDKLSSASLLSKLYFQEAQLYYLLSDTKTANKLLKTALKVLLPEYDSNNFPNKENLYPENAFINIFDLFAIIQTNPQKSLDYYNLSFYISDLLAKNTTAQEGKLILLNEKRKRSEKCLELYYALQNSSDESKYTLAALKLSERYKSSILKETVGKKDLLKVHPKDTLLIQQQTLLKKQEQLTNRLIRTPLNTNTNQKVLIRDQLSFINSELKKLNIIIENKYGIANNALNIPELHLKLVEEKATLIEYFYGKNAIYQIIISEEVTAFNKIILNSLNTTIINDFIKYFDSPSAINNNILKYTEDAFTLYNLLQLNQIKDKENLLIIPDGLLHFIPFDALITEKIESKSFKNMPFFVKTHHSVFNSSASFYLNENKKQNKPSVLGVFPVFKGSNLELTYSVNEAKSIENEIETTILMNDNATKKNFLSNANKHSILHLSTHGTSGSFFEPAQIAFTGEPLSINELYALDLNPDLVVLSACETGVGVLQRGEGAMSVARGFQYAGAKKVLFSLWQISDLSTSQIMASFYNSLDNIKSISYSNRQSKLRYLNNNTIKNLKKSPYYWSAFTLYGNFDKVEVNTFNIWLIIGVTLPIMLLLLWLYKQKNGKQSLGIS